jgi:hypothetical protein
MMFDEEGFGLHFEMPNYPNYGQLEDYDTALQAALDKHAEQTDIQYAGVVVSAAAAAGLIENWHSLHNAVPLTNLRGLDGQAVLWASTQVRAYMQTLKMLDPKAWRAWCGMPVEIETEPETEFPRLRP